MRLNIKSIISLVMVFTAVSCTDDELFPGETGDGETLSSLRFEVNTFSVNVDGVTRSAEPSKNPEPESPEEKKIRDFWLFQFKSDSTQLATPQYYSIPKDGKTLDELTLAAYKDLVKDTPMTIFVITNTGDSAWVSGTEFDTLDKVKKQKLRSPFPIRAGIDNDKDGKDDIYIPMAGQKDNVTARENGVVVVPVTRMYAKVKIQVSFNQSSMSFYYADVTGIPWYCRVSPLSDKIDADNGEPAAASYPEGTRMISRAFSSKEIVTDSDGNQWLILYMPENIRGEIDSADKSAGKDIPKDALTVSIRSKYEGEDYYYTVYPGENKVNNFNIRRNCVYRVNIDVRNVTTQHTPSSNCFVVKPGEKLSFEPYHRVETGGGYDIKTYLDPTDSIKRIDSLAIIWQTKDCIGDNSKGDLVYLVANTDKPEYSKIVIKKTGVEGNALIGAYNSSKQIIWSWHIWVTPNEPDNIANAIVYTTYRWDNEDIHFNEPRIPGYGVMPCNIGALAFRSEDDMPITVDVQYGEQHYSIPAGDLFPESQIRTFGMLYQWGRKDPFPPMIRSTGIEDRNDQAEPETGGTSWYPVPKDADLEYNNFNTGNHYANDNTTIVEKTSEYFDRGNLFYSKCLLQRPGFFNWINEEDPIKYSIAHPTVYISGTSSETSDNYNPYNGDWCGPDGNDRLWGGETGKDGLLIEFTWDYEDWKWDRTDAHLYNNYGTKSIFDPCPTGWRVPPGDLWLGFTRTGRNPENYEEDVNYCDTASGFRPGLSMYVQRWRGGPTVYFPLQGTRIFEGRCSNPGICGNYHNATCDDERRVNLLHLHRNMDKVSKWTGSNGPEGNNMLFKLFEYVNPKYYAKSTAGPIRCVRDSR